MLNDSSTEPSIYKLSSRAPRFFLPGHGRIFLLIVRIWTVYTASILLASSRILIAAFRSLSISFPHVQRYTLSDNPSSFFIFPHLLHFLLEGKKRSTFTNSFPFQSSLYSSIFRNIPYPLSCTLFPKCRHWLIAFISISSTATISYWSVILRLSLCR